MKHITLMAMFSLCFMSLSAFKNIEICKKEVAALLQESRPELLSAFTAFCLQYDKSVITFFDTYNNFSIKHHITRMEKDLEIFKKVAQDKQFMLVKSKPLELNDELESLIAVLKKYNSLNSVSLACKVRHFKKLLPYPMNTWSDFSLFWCLHHRFNC